MAQSEKPKIRNSLPPEMSVEHSRHDSIGQHRDDIFFAAIETTRMPMLVTDPRQPDNPIVFANRAFLSMSGYAAEEIMGHYCRFLQGPDTDRATVAAVREAVRDRREISTEILNYRKDGTSFWNALYVSPVYNQDKDLGRTPMTAGKLAAPAEQLTVAVVGSNLEVHWGTMKQSVAISAKK